MFLKLNINTRDAVLFLYFKKYEVHSGFNYIFLMKCVPAFWRSGIPAFQHSSIPAFRRSGVPAFRRSGIPAFWHSGIPAFRRSGIPAFLVLVNALVEPMPRKELIFKNIYCMCKLCAIFEVRGILPHGGKNSSKVFQFYE